MGGYSRKDPTSGDLHYFAEDGKFVGYARENPLTGDLEYFQAPGGGDPYRPSGRTTDDSDVAATLVLGLIPAGWVLLSGALMWMSDYLSGGMVLVLAVVTFVGYLLAVRAWRAPFWLVLLVGIAGNGLLVLAAVP